MKYEVWLLPIAGQDVLRISDVLSGYPGKARRLLGEIESKLRLLEYMPNMWPQYAPGPEYRRMDLEDYLLLYTVDDSRRMVKVCRVLHDKEDLQPANRSAEGTPPDQNLSVISQ